MDVLFHFPSVSQYTGDRTYGRTVCIFITLVFTICLNWDSRELMFNW